MRLATTTLALAAATALLAACGQSGSSENEEASQAAAPAAVEAPANPEERQKLLASYPAPYNTADLDNGAAKFGMCQSCHTIVPGGANMTGPNLHGVFGRKAAQVEGFKYSDAIKQSGIVWDAAHLDQWLANPKTYLPGTKMSFAGLKDAKDRTDLIAFLMVETGYKPQ